MQLKKLFLPILIAPVLLLSVGRNAHAQSPGPRQTPNRSEESQAAPTRTAYNQQPTENPSPSLKNLISPAKDYATPTDDPPKNNGDDPGSVIVGAAVVQAICAALLVAITFLLYCVGR